MVTERHANTTLRLFKKKTMKIQKCIIIATIIFLFLIMYLFWGFIYLKNTVKI